MKTKPAKHSRSLLKTQFERALIDGAMTIIDRPAKRPFTIKRNRVGGISFEFHLQDAFDELLAFFIVALLARNEKLYGYKLDSYTDDEAYSLLAEHEEERKEYIPLALGLLDEQVEQKLEGAINELLSEVKWQALYRLGFPIDSTDLKGIFQRAFNQAKKRIDAPSAGRKKGSKTIKSDKERQIEQTEFEEKAIEAIKKLYPFSDAEHSSSNNKKPLKKRIAQDLDISVKTLTRKTKPNVGRSFEELVEIAEMRQRK
jgi:hypothetical protein